eukprot:TRINITY_DN10531_c0_g1_i2.p1 TRINITY_DN10531_c0_g1~~TRINITY_DN10531_c0_g1_i2.p1  ORF type:complete len:342 (+),score=93.07 TRINITY_DN10531_c0_g1_i2:189-1214(+)
MLASTPHCVWGAAGGSTPEAPVMEGKGNPLWGLPLQHGWQEASGRLCINASQDPHDVALAPACWWGCANYYFTVLPFLGARRAGAIRGGVRLMPLREGDAAGRFCDGSRLALCETGAAGDTIGAAVDAWAAFFREAAATAHACGNATQDDPSDPLTGRLMEAYWGGHTATIQATERCEAFLTGCGKQEARFGEAWSTLVKYLGPTRFDVNYTMTTALSSLLPARPLAPRDVPGFVPDFPAATNRGVVYVEALDALTKATRGRLLAVWERVMCAEAARATARDAIHRGLTDTSVLVVDALKLLWDAAAAAMQDPCAHDAGAPTLDISWEDARAQMAPLFPAL